MKIIPVNQIDIGKRHRKDMGDLEALAANIKELGLLQPVGVTEELMLIFGERRLRDCRDILNQTEIPVRIINISSLVAGEFAENELRKDFTTSERVAIAKTLEEQIPERRGNPSIRLKCDEFQRRSDDLVAKKAGFRNRHSYRRAKKVVAKGSVKLVEAMDNGKVAIATAALIADASTKEQDELLELNPRLLRESTRNLRRLDTQIPSASEGFPKIKGAGSNGEFFDELKNHRRTLEQILVPICNCKDVTLKPVEKHHVLRLLREIEVLVEGLSGR